MTEPNYTHVVILLDKSSSMKLHGQDQGARNGINAMLNDLSKESGRITVQIAQFATTLKTPSFPMNAREHYRLDQNTYKADGISTALWRSFSELIDQQGAWLSSLKEEFRPSKIVFVVQTDGQENDSGPAYQNAHTLVEKVERQKIQYNWQFVFLGADMDAIASASQMGISANMSMNYAGTREDTTGALYSVSKSISNYHRASNVKDLSLDYRQK